MSELMEMNAERVDAVDHPASRRKFLIRKSAEETAVEKITKALVSLGSAPGGGTNVGEKPGAATPSEIWESAVAMLKAAVVEPGADGALAYTKAMIPGLNAMAKSVGAPVEFTEKGPMWSDEHGKKKPGAADSPMPGEPKMKEALDALASLGTTMKASMDAQTKTAEAMVKSAEAVSKSVEALVEMQKTAVTKAEEKPKPKSLQPGEKEPIAKGTRLKMGEGVFTSAIFGAEAKAGA